MENVYIYTAVPHDIYYQFQWKLISASSVVYIYSAGCADDSAQID